MDETPVYLRRRASQVLRAVRQASYPLHAPLTITAYAVGGEPIDFATAAAADYEPIAVGDAWGRPWDTTWFRIAGAVPDAWAGRHVVLRVELGGVHAGVGFGVEGLLWSADGDPRCGVSARHR